MELVSPYDEVESAHSRASQEDPWVMYLIVRQSLGMSPGKIGAQCGHAVGKIYDHYIRTKSCCDNLDMINRFELWSENSFRKVTLKAKDSKWENLKEKLTCVVVRDAGLTEIESGSETVIGVWPMRKSERPNIIRKLQAL